jgi:hypothetical protein
MTDYRILSSSMTMAIINWPPPKVVQHLQPHSFSIAKQNTISLTGEIIEKHRACHNHTFMGPLGQSLNTRTVKEALELCTYSHYLCCIINYIVFLRSQHPHTPIIMSKIDLDSAYRRVHSAWSFAVQCIMFLGALAYLLLCLPFGATAAPSEFCVISKTICDVANALMQDASWNPDDTVMPYHHLLPSMTLLDHNIPFAQSATLDVEYPPQPFECLSEVYVDDLILLGLALPHLTQCILTAVAVTTHCIFWPIHPSETTFWTAIISLHKLADEGQVSEIKTIPIRWLINTRLLLISLPPNKHHAWTSKIQCLLAQGFTTKTDLETLLGRLNHIGYILPLARHFLNRLRSLKDSPWHCHTKTIPPAQQEDLKLWIKFLSSAASGISLILLCYHKPDVTCWSDACLAGMGGYDSNGQAWHW